MSRPVIVCGADRLLGGKEFSSLVAGKKAGAVVNHTAVTSNYTFWPAVLAEQTGARLEVLFSPEHGLWGEEQDQAPCGSYSAGPGGARVVSLYGGDPGSLKPDPALLAGLDLLLFDIQDIGSRYYTYIYTLAYAMEAAAEAGVPLVVLDRSNPLGGERVEGPPLKPGFESFVGRFAGMPVRHGMTVAELALYFSAVHRIGETPEVVKLAGWRRKLTAFDCSFPWVLPSPNMPTPDTALVYPGMCLLEGTNLSEGRGTTRPFEIFGAPWLEAFQLVRMLGSLGLSGVRFRPHRFIPTFGKFSGRLCSGAQVQVTDTHAYRSFLTGAAVIYCAAALAPEEFAWLERPYEFVSGIPAIDLLTGGDSFRKAIDRRVSFEELSALCESDPGAWRELRREFLLYD